MSKQEKGSPATKRLFFALWPAPELQQLLHGLAMDALLAGDGRRTPSANIHLTLAFLGSVTPPVQDCLERAADGIRGEHFCLVLDSLDCVQRRGIAWIGAERASRGLLALMKQLNESLRDCGYAPDSRPFYAHLTLARHVRRCPRFSQPAPIEWAVRDFVLVESRLGPGGADYEILRRWPLA